MKLYRYSILIIALIFFFYPSCSENEVGIFYYLENETKESDYSLDNELTGLSMSKDGGAGGYYYLNAGGSIWLRGENQSSNDWKKVSFPSGADYCTAMTISDVSGSNRIYACFVFESRFRFYSAVPGRYPSWIQITDTRVDDVQITRLKEVTDSGDSYLIAFTQEGSNFYAYYSNDGNTYSTTGITAQTRPFKDIVWDSNNGFYYVISRNNMFRDPDIIPNNFSKHSTLSAGGNYMGLLYYNNLVYVSKTNGYVYSSPDGNTWNSSTNKEVNDEDVIFTNFGVTDTAGTPTNIIVGTFGRGFYEMQGGNVVSLTRFDNIEATDLYTSYVIDFFVDPDTDTKLFILTESQGLWYYEYDDGEWSHRTLQ